MPTRIGFVAWHSCQVKIVFWVPAELVWWKFGTLTTAVLLGRSRLTRALSMTSLQIHKWSSVLLSKNLACNYCIFIILSYHKHSELFKPYWLWCFSNYYIYNLHWRFFFFQWQIYPVLEAQGKFRTIGFGNWVLKHKSLLTCYFIPNLCILATFIFQQMNAFSLHVLKLFMLFVKTKLSTYVHIFCSIELTFCCNFNSFDVNFCTMFIG